MSAEFEVEIDGVSFKVIRTDSESSGLELEPGQAELIARACLMADSFGGEEASDEAFKVPIRQTFGDIGSESRTSAPEWINPVGYGVNASFADVQDTQTEYLAMRRSAEKLSRQIEKDSRRYDGYYEMY